MIPCGSRCLIIFDTAAAARGTAAKFSMREWGKRAERRPPRGPGRFNGHRLQPIGFGGCRRSVGVARFKGMTRKWRACMACALKANTIS